jgi:hypothetical protein
MPNPLSSTPPATAIPALLASELPFIIGYLLIASTVLALIDGDLDSQGGAAGTAVALLALAGLLQPALHLHLMVWMRQAGGAAYSMRRPRVW